MVAESIETEITAASRGILLARGKAALAWILRPFRRPWLWFLGFNAPDFKDDRVKRVKRGPTADQLRYAEMVAKQIEVEQGLANTRMIWNLTFQGFTIAGYALVASANSATPKKLILETLIALASGVIAYATLRGVVASQVQRQYLKDCWEKNNLDQFFPQPFSSSHTSSRGRWPAYSICLTLILMWGALLIAQFVYEGDKDPVTKVEVVPHESPK